MVLDSSALVAILREEPGHEGFLQKALSADRTVVGATVAFETAMVLSGRWHRDARSTLHGLLRSIGAEIVPFSEEHYEAAVSAFLRYGNGRHPAGLNFGDCMSYAFARVSGLPLLYIGDDFSKTDITAA
jgi:ribonuclease VapC